MRRKPIVILSIIHLYGRRILVGSFLGCLFLLAPMDGGRFLKEGKETEKELCG